MPWELYGELIKGRNLLHNILAAGGHELFIENNKESIKSRPEMWHTKYIYFNI